MKLYRTAAATLESGACKVTLCSVTSSNSSVPRSVVNFSTRF